MGVEDARNEVQNYLKSMITLICTGDFKEDYKNMNMLTESIYESACKMYLMSKLKLEIVKMVAKED